MLFFPKIAPTASNYPRLEKLARVAAQQGEMEWDFSARRDHPRENHTR
jgi:hypothetical protein